MTFIDKNGQVTGNTKPPGNGNGSGIVEAANKWGVLVTLLSILGGFILAFNFMSGFATKADVNGIRDDFKNIKKELREELGVSDLKEEIKSMAAELEKTKNASESLTEELKAVKQGLPSEKSADIRQIRKDVARHEDWIDYLNRSMNRHIFQHETGKANE